MNWSRRYFKSGEKVLMSITFAILLALHSPMTIFERVRNSVKLAKYAMGKMPRELIASLYGVSGSIHLTTRFWKVSSCFKSDLFGDQH